MASDPSARSARRAVRIGKYEIIQHVATGGMGAVYKAHDTELGREVALKVLPHELAAKPILLERFRREARSAAKLRHENIVTIYECGEFGGTYYLAMEFVDGIDLHEYISRKGKLDPGEARYLVLQAARALHHAYKRGIIHRDIKPANFLVTVQNDHPLLKLTDLGLAREIKEGDPRVTRDGTTVGTVDYMAPEQARDSGLADIRSDLYALGCTAFHMLAGQPPFPGGGLTERIFKHLEVEPPDVREFNPRVPADFAEAIRRLLAKRPEDRFQTPKELLHALFRPAARRGARTSPPRPDSEDLVPIDEDEIPPPRPVDRPRPSRSEAETRSEKDSNPDRQAVPPPSSSERRAAPDGPRSGRRPARRKLRPRKPGYGSNLLVALAVIWVVIIAIGLLIIFLPGDKGAGDTDRKAAPGVDTAPAPRPEVGPEPEADRQPDPEPGPGRL